jgi:hypothetical protein
MDTRPPDHGEDQMKFPRLGWSAAVMAVICATGMVWAVPAAATAAGPQAGLSIEPGPSPLSVTFVASAANFKPISYVFQFGDGQTTKTTSPTVVHTYAKPGHFVPRVTETGTSRSTVTTAGPLNVDACPTGKSCTETLKNAFTVQQLSVTGPIDSSMSPTVTLFVGQSRITNCNEPPSPLDINGGVTDHGFTGPLTLTAVYHASTLTGLNITCFASTVPFIDKGGKLVTSGELPTCSVSSPAPPCVKSIVHSGLAVKKTLLIPPGDPTVGSL